MFWPPGLYVDKAKIITAEVEFMSTGLEISELDLEMFLDTVEVRFRRVLQT